LEDTVILWTFLVAAGLFLIFWVIRGKSAEASVPRQDSPPPLPAGPEAGEFATAAVSDETPYAPPLPPPLPSPEPKGIARYFKVPTAHYRSFDLLLIALVFLIYCGLTVTGGDDSVPVDKKITPVVLVSSMFLQLLIMGIVCGFVMRRIRQSEWLGLRWRQWWLAFLIAPLTVFFMWMVLAVTQFSGLNAWLQQALGIESSMQEAVKALQEAKDPMVVILMAVAAVIVAPFAEEVVFRGYLYSASKRFCGPLGAMIFSSLVFAAAHGNAVALLPLFILAMLLCLIYETTGSIWANISVHFLFNAATVALQLMARYHVIDIAPPN
jgi:membrane protease YdiL (CAAX protease family)